MSTDATQKKSLIPDEIVTPKAAAYAMYLSGEKNKDIAKKVGVKPIRIGIWAKEGDWAKTRDELEAISMKESNQSFAKFIVNHREEIARRQLKQAEQIEAMIMERTKPREDGSAPFNAPRDLSLLADALKKVSDVTSRVAGIHEKALSEMIGDDAKKSQMLIVQVQPIFPANTNKKKLDAGSIDVEHSEVKRAAPF